MGNKESSSVMRRGMELGAGPHTHLKRRPSPLVRRFAKADACGSQIVSVSVCLRFNDVV